MGMTIDEAIKLMIRGSKYDYDGSAEDFFEAYNMSIEIMRKYQQIVQIYQKWNEVNDFSYKNAMQRIGAVILTHEAIPIEKLEQIRAEIEQKYNKFRNMSDKWDERACGLGTALEIIDKGLKEQTT